MKPLPALGRSNHGAWLHAVLRGVRTALQPWIWLLLVPASALAAEPDVGQSLVGYWRISSEGESPTFLQILRVGPPAQGSAQAEAEIGLNRRVTVGLGVDVFASAQGLRLRFVVQGARFDLRRVGEAEFAGHRVNRSGVEKVLRMTRVDDPGDVPASSPALYVVQPGADVPAECAGFSGLWKGQWLFGTQAPLWVWVLEVDARCQARVAYMTRFVRPRIAQALSISGGTITVRSLAGGSAVVLRLAGDEIRGALTSPHGDRGNSIVLTREPDTLP